MFGLMLFMFFFFLGSIVMFFYLVRRLETLARGLNDEHAQLRVLLRAMESRLEKIAQIERINALFQGDMESSPGQPSPDGTTFQEESPSRDPLLHLSFDTPSPLDENMGRKLDLKPEPKNWDLEITPEQK